MGACFNTHPWFFGAIVLIACFVGCMELANFVNRRFAFTGVALPILVLVGFLTSVEPSMPGVVAILVALFMAGVLMAGKPGFLATEIASLYVGAPLAAAILLQQTWPASEIHVIGGWSLRPYILLVLIPLWIGDSAAIFAGKAWGKHLLAPNISPKKTWEGAIANFLGCVLGAVGVGYFLGLPIAQSIACGVASGILGQAGDLYESALKRKVGVKDSGAVLPGHGGVLDRLDSLLATAIPIALIVYLWPK